MASNLSARIGSLKNKIPSCVWLLGLFPIYFGRIGLYRTVGYKQPEFESFFLPLSFFVGLILIVILSYKFLADRVTFPKWMQRLFFFYVFSYAFCMIGMIASNSYLPLLSYLQLLSGFIGVVFAYWIVREKQIDFEYAAYFVSKLFLVLIALNLIQGLLTDWIEFTNRYAYNPGTPWWSIGHSSVYYPAIVAMVFLFAAPAWQKKLKPVFFVLLYIAIACYIYLFQVRTPFYAYILGFGGYVLFFANNRKKVLPTLAVILASMIAVFSVVGGLAQMLSIPNRIVVIDLTLSNRITIFAQYFQSLTSDPLYPFIGSAFKGRTPDAFRIVGSVIQFRSAHNQYLEFIDLGGVTMLVGFACCVIPMFKIIKNRTGEDKRFAYWLFIIIMQFIVDLNLNLPIRNTNPAIMYWFYWAGCCIYAQDYCIFQAGKILVKCGRSKHE